MKGRKKQAPAAAPEPADAAPFFARFLESQQPEEDAEAKVSARGRRAQATAKSRGGAKKSAAKKSAAKKSGAKKSAGKKVTAAASAKAVTLKYPSDRDEWVLYPYQLEAARRGPGSGDQTLKYPSDGDEDTAYALSYVDRKDVPATARAKAKEARVTITKPHKDIMDVG